MRHKFNDMPEEYDIEKEPVTKYRLQRPVGLDGRRVDLSGTSYVVVLMKGEHRGGRVIIAKPKNCDHGETICTGGVNDGGVSCADSWQFDYSILWSRTAGGRRLITELGIEHDKYQNPDHPAAKFNREADKSA